MSTTIDERVVEMRFDNKHFESNVATSMSTLEKLKQKLNLSGASKGLENLNAACKSNNISALGTAADTVGLRFNAMYTVADQVLRNITTRVQHTAESMIKALTLDPVITGFKEYETQINSVQTILSNTQSKGTTIDQVNAALDELNKYADLTIYNFTEMTRNIGTFTAAGIDLDTSVRAIQGIANLAAMSGSTSQQASTAMYQLSQALASGTVKLMDWNSVVNAGMGGQLFQDALKETSRLLKTGADEAIESTGSFRESLREGWLTAEVLTETLKKFTTTGAVEYLADYTGLSKETVDATLEATDAWGDEADAIDKAAEALAKKSGKNKDEIKSALEMAKNAEDAATKIKTFTQLWDVLKESAQSGWAQTWKLIIGDFNEAKTLLTELGDYLTGFINRMSDWRNTILRFGLKFSDPWASITDKLSKAGFEIGGVKKIAQTIDTITGKTKDAVDTLEYFQNIVSEVWRGDWGVFGSDPDTDRFTRLDKAGYDHRVVQDLVNKGSRYKITMEDVEASHKKFGLTLQTTQKETEETTESINNASKAFIELSDAQLKQAGLTEDEIDLYRALEKEAKRLNMTVSELAEDMSTNDGRTLLIDSFRNIGNMFVGIGTAIKNAWVDIFNPPGVGELAIKLYGALKSLNEFTEKLRFTDKETGELTETAKQLQRTFKGIFAIVDIVATVLGGGLKIAFNVLSKVLSAFDMDILELTANIGDALVAFRDWVFEGNLFAKTVDGLIAKLPGLISKFKAWFAVFKQTPAVQKLVNAINAIRDAFSKLFSGEIDSSEFARMLGENLAKALKSLPGIALQIGKDFIAGFSDGIGFSISGVINKIVNFCLNFVSAFAKALGVQSPSWKAYDTATDFFQGFINGVKAMIGSVLDVLKGIGGQIVKVFKSFWDFITDESGNIEWGKLFAGGTVVAMIWVLKQIATEFSGIANALGGIDDLLVGAGKTLKSFSKVLNGIAWDLKAKALMKMAIAIGILVASIWVLTTIDDPAKLWSAVGVIAVLAGVLIGLSVAMDKLSSASVQISKKGASLDGLKTGLLQIGIAIFLLAATVKLIGDMDPDEAKQGFIGLAGIAIGMIVFLKAMGNMSGYTKDVSSIGTMLKKLAVAMILMVVACKLVGMLSAEDMLQGAAFAAGFAIFVIAITKVAKSAGNNVSKVGGMVLKLTIAMALMVGLCKLISTLSAEEMLKGAAFAAGFVIFVAALVKVTKIGKKQQIAKLGGLVLSVSTSLLLMVGVCKLVGKLSVEEMIKGAAFVAGFVILLKVLVSILKIGSEQKMTSVAGTILAMSAAIAILAGVAVLLSFIDIGGLAKGIIAVGLLSTMMTVMIKSLKGAQNVKGAILMMAIAIGVMAASIAALSFIDTKSLISATGTMAVAMSAFALMAKSMKGIKNVKIAPLIALTSVVLILAGVIVLLSRVDPLSAISSAGSLAILMLSMSVVLKILNSIGGSIGKSLKGVLSLTLMAVPLLAFVGVLALMSGVDNAMTNVQALVLLAGALTLMLIPLTLIGTFIGAALAGVLALTAMAIPMLAFVGVLALLDCVDNAMANALLLGTFMSTMADVLVKVSLVAPLALVADIAIAGLVLVIAAIGALAVAIGALMDEFPSIQEFLDSGLPILEQLAGSIGTMIGEFIGGIGEGLGDSLVKIGEDIAAFMDTIATASASASKIKSGSFDGVEELLLVLLEIGGTSVGTSITDLFSNIFSGEDSMEKFETDGVAFFNAMKKIGEASSEVSINEEAMSSIIGVAQEMSNLQQSLESIGGVIDWFAGKDDLGTFGANAASFVFSMKLAFNSLDGAEFNTEAMDQIVVAATSLSTLQQSLEPIGGVISWFSGRDDLGTFGTSVASFVTSMRTAFDSLEGVTLDEAGMSSIITAATKLTELQTHLEPMGGVVSWFSGRDDLGTFGENIGLFAEGMAALKTGMGEDGIPESVVTSVMNAGKAIVELQEALPEDGWFDSKMDLDDFSEYVEDFAEAMATFGEKAATLNPDSVNVAINTAQRIRLLINSLANLDTSGVETFTGVGTGGVGADGVAYDIAEAMAEFSSKVAEINTDAVSTAVNAALRLKSLIASLVGLDTSGIENFKPVDIGNQMKNYADKVAGIDTEAVAVSVSAANKLKNLIAGLVGLDPSGVANFRAAAIGTALKTYSNSISEVNVSSIVASIGGAKVVKSFISSLAGLDTSGVSSFKTAINQLSTVSIEELVEAFSGASSKLSSAGADMIEGLTKGMRSKLSTVKVVTVLVATTSVDAITSKIAAFSKAGGDMAMKLASGFSSKKSSITSAISSCLSSATTTLRNKYTAFYNAGAYLVKGFAKGIDENTWRAEAKARAMAEAAVEAAKDELEINSPSKVFKKIGSGIPEGFAMGIGMLGGSVKDSVASMASTAITATKSTMGTILDALSADMDAQPTIRPVIDLSDVRTGANAINGMLDGVRTVDVRANLNAINATMNARLQNGSNDDVVSAINELNAGLKNVRGDTYNFEGITYSDGDEVSDAVQTLVRHIRLGRRM